MRDPRPLTTSQPLGLASRHDPSLTHPSTVPLLPLVSYQLSSHTPWSYFLAGIPVCQALRAHCLGSFSNLKQEDINSNICKILQKGWYSVRNSSELCQVCSCETLLDLLMCANVKAQSEGSRGNRGGTKRSVLRRNKLPHMVLSFPRDLSEGPDSFHNTAGFKTMKHVRSHGLPLYLKRVFLSFPSFSPSLFLPLPPAPSLSLHPSHSLSIAIHHPLSPTCLSSHESNIWSA